MLNRHIKLFTYVLIKLIKSLNRIHDNHLIIICIFYEVNKGYFFYVIKEYNFMVQIVVGNK